MLPIIKKYKKRLILLVAVLLIYIVTIFCLGYKIPWFDKHPDWGYFPQHTNPNIVIEEVNLDSITLETVVLPLNSKHKLVFGHKKIDDDYDSLIVLNENLQLVYAEKILHLNSWFYPEIGNNRIVFEYDTSYWVNKEKKYLTLHIAYDFNNFKKITLPSKYGLYADDIYKKNVVEFRYFRRDGIFVNTNLKLVDSIITGNTFVKGSWWDRFNLSPGSYNSTTYKKEYYTSRFVQKLIGYGALNIANIKTDFKLEYHYQIEDVYQFNTPQKITDTLYFNYAHSFYRAFVKNSSNVK